MVDFGKKKTIINRLMLVFKQKKSSDIVAYAEKIINDYTGCSSVHLQKLKRRKKRFSVLNFFSVTIAFICILWCTFKIFF